MILFFFWRRSNDLSLFYDHFSLCVVTPTICFFISLNLLELAFFPHPFPLLSIASFLLTLSNPKQANDDGSERRRRKEITNWRLQFRQKLSHRGKDGKHYTQKYNGGLCNLYITVPVALRLRRQQANTQVQQSDKRSQEGRKGQNWRSYPKVEHLIVVMAQC